MAGADLWAVAGSKIYIGPTMPTQLADFVAADFNAVVWTEIDGWQTMGAIGDTAEAITTSLINRGRDVKQKGTWNAGSMENTFALVPEDTGQLALIAASKTRLNYPFKIVYSDLPAVRTATATISQATPGVVTWNAHGLAENTGVVFTTTGALPTGLTAGTTYYVKTVLTANTFTVAATRGGTAIDTSSAGSGTHTVTTVPSGTENYFVGLVMTAQRAGGEANTVQTISGTVEINSNIVEVGALG